MDEESLRRAMQLIKGEGEEKGAEECCEEEMTLDSLRQD
jgi:hypothetical protein